MPKRGSPFSVNFQITVRISGHDSRLGNGGMEKVTSFNVLGRFSMHSLLRISILACSIGLPIAAHAQGFDTTKIDQVFGRTGQKTGDVYRLGFTRTDLHVV